MTDFYYDTHYTLTNSTSLTDVWYSNADKKLFVKFKSSGTIAGYDGVPAYRMREFADFIQKPYYSAGSYYSRYIKPNYKGISSDVNFVHVNDRKVSTDPTLRFTITGFAPVSVTVDAKSMDEAVELFRQAHPGAKISEAAVKFA